MARDAEFAKHMLEKYSFWRSEEDRTFLLTYVYAYVKDYLESLDADELAAFEKLEGPADLYANSSKNVYTELANTWRPYNPQCMSMAATFFRTFS